MALLVRHDFFGKAKAPFQFASPVPSFFCGPHTFLLRELIASLCVVEQRWGQQGPQALLASSPGVGGLVSSPESPAPSLRADPGQAEGREQRQQSEPVPGTPCA